MVLLPFATVGGGGAMLARVLGGVLAGECLDAFTPEECRNYFKHAGYA